MKKQFVVYHIASTMQKQTYFYKWHAEAAVKKLGSAYAYATIEEYQTKVVGMVTRKNLLSGQEYQEPSNTPGYLSPSSEAYWSM